MKKLRILHLVQFLGVGGLEKVLFLLIKEQIREGHYVQLIVYDSEETWVELFRSEGINVDTTYKKSQGYDKNLLRHLEKFILSQDIVHTHDLNPLMYAAPLKALRFLKLKSFPKLIHTAHGMNHLHQRPITRWYERICSLMTDSTIGVSQGVCDYYHALGVSKKKIININNGTEVQESPATDRYVAKYKLAQEFKTDPQKLFLGAVARIVPLKDQKLLCEAAESFPDFHFFLVGPSGDDAYWTELQRIKPDNLTMTGGRSDVDEILKGLDWFVSASTHEGIPISVLEAGAQGTPCLLSDIPGHKSIQTNAQKELALFFETGNVDSLILSLKRIQKERELAKILSLNLFFHVKEHFSSFKMYQRYLKVYQGQYDTEA